MHTRSALNNCLRSGLGRYPSCLKALHACLIMKPDNFTIPIETAITQDIVKTTQCSVY